MAVRIPGAEAELARLRTAQATKQALEEQANQPHVDREGLRTQLLAADRELADATAAARAAMPTSVVQAVPSAPAQPSDLDRVVADLENNGMPLEVGPTPAPPTLQAASPSPNDVGATAPVPQVSAQPVAPAGNPAPTGASTVAPQAAPQAAPTGTSTPTSNEPALRDIQYNFEPNTLNQYDSYAYHFRLSMINDLDANDPNLAAKVVNNEIRKIIVAESGVTAGFNIVDCEIEDIVSANFRSRGSMTTELKLVVAEPYGLTLTDRLFNSSRSLGVRNWRLAPMVLELEFRYIREDGTYFTPTGDQKLVKVYQVILIDFDAKLTEVGTIYEIKASVKGNLGFNDFYYIIPQSHRISTTGGPVTGAQPVTATPNTGNTGAPARPQGLLISSENGTVGKLFENLGTQLTEFYRKARTENTTNPVLPVMVYDFQVAPALSVQQINFAPTENSRRLSFNSTGENSGEITVSRGIAVGELVDDVLASLKDPTFFMPNMNTTGEILIPRIECITQNIGWDGLLNDYIRKFTFVISMKSSNRPIPYARFGDEFQGNVARMRTRLQDLANKSIRKSYDYYYTGLNTEIINADIKFNMLHIVPQALLQTLALPEFADSIRTQGISEQFEQASRTLSEAEARRAAIENIETGPPPASAIASQQTAIDAANQTLLQIRANSLFPFEEANATLLGLSPDTVSQQQAARAALQEVSASNRQLAGVRTFAEDQPRAPLSLEQLSRDPLRVRYGADPRDIANFFSRPTPSGASSTGGSAQDSVRPLVSSILSQIYDRSNQQLLEIELDIRGDPYWLGVTDLERQQELLKFLENRTEGGFWGAPTSTASNGQSSGSGSRLNVVNVHDQDANIMLKFRAGAAPSEQNGFQQLNSESDMFYGVYTVISVTHEFKQGKFTQKLKAMRDTLVNIQALRNAAQGQSQEQANPTQPPAVAARNARSGYYSNLADAQEGAVRYRSAADFVRANPNLYLPPEQTAAFRLEAAANAEVARLRGSTQTPLASNSAPPTG